MPTPVEVHRMDIRLMNNAHLQYPVCLANKPIDTEWHGRLTNLDERVTCKACIRIFPERYPWVKAQRCDRANEPL